MEQRALLTRAFAGDDVVSAFDAAKTSEAGAYIRPLFSST